MKQGAFTFVLHSHLPYCRQAGRWPHGEDWIHEAAAGCYIPLLQALWDLRDEAVPFKLTIGLTPVLVEQLRDPLVNQHLHEYVSQLSAAAEGDAERYRAEGNDHLARLAGFYGDKHAAILAAYHERFNTDLVGAFKSLQESGHVEIATSAATHGYLPLFDRDSTIAAQLGVGAASYREVFGRDPRAIWLPECAYRPSRSVERDGGRLRPGIERFLAEQGLRVFFSETLAVEGGRAIGKAAGDALGPYGEVGRRYRLPAVGPELRRGSTFEAYWVGDANVAVIARNGPTGLQVWSAEHGYPGDFWYREFHRKDGVSGLRYWRTTGRGTGLGEKAEYEPEPAMERAVAHARHFSALVEDEVARYHASSGGYGIVVAAYDTELFGHWWFEGVEWLKEVLRVLAASEAVELTNASEFIEHHPPRDALELPESSWGQGGGHFTWMNADTAWMWPVIHGVERRMETLVAAHPRAQGATLEALRQAAREALLTESSDWPFLVTTGQAREYAITRFQQHVERFEELATAIEAGKAGRELGALAAQYYERDRLFASIDYRLFAERPGQVAEAA